MSDRLAADFAFSEAADPLAVSRLITESAADAIFLLDADGRTTYANPAAERLFGWSAEELRGRKLHDLVHHHHPDGRPFPMADCPLGRVFLTGENLTQHEDTLFHKDGTPIAVACSNAAVVEDGRIMGGVLIARDIRRRRANERKLRESEERLRAITDSIDQMIWATRPDGYHDYYNQRWYDFTGAPEGTTDGEAWNDMFHPDDQDRAWAVWQHSLATGEPYHIEYRLRHHSGTYRWVLGRAQPVQDSSGRIIRWYGTCTDIDALKRAEDELRRTSALLALIGDSTPDLIYAKDRRSRMLYANKAAQTTIGRSADELIGRSDLEWGRDEEEARAIIANDQRVMMAGETLDLDETFTGPDGRTRYYRSVKSPLRDGDGAIIGLVGITSDVTERRRAEERERLLAREVDHRAKNLLAIVQSVVQLTRADDIQSFTRLIGGRIQSLARAHSLLAAARWDGAELRQLIDEELAPYVTAAEGRIHIAGPAASLRPEAAQALALVIHELATNAAKYGSLSTPDGRLDVRWDFDQGGEETRLVLVWRECGGPAVVAPTRRGFGSKLIGASIERQLGGKATLDWQAGGLLCTLAIPAAQLHMMDREPRSEARAQRPSPSATAPSIAGRNILVVEDEALIAMQIEQALTAAGGHVIGPAARISEGFDLIGTHPIDAALLDVNVGQERGYVLADVLAARGIPFAFVTGIAARSVLPDHLHHVPVLSKPFEAARLVEVVAGLVVAQS